MDIFTSKKRSQIMSNIRGNETKPEILVRTYLFSKGLRYRKNVKTLPGKPDIVLAKYKTVILVHGCFWHGHKNCKASTLPTSNKLFWKKKISGNILRDKSNIKQLRKLGWRVIEIWQCKIKNAKIREKTLTSLINKIQN